jgi:hypothetical protein
MNETTFLVLVGVLVLIVHNVRWCARRRRLGLVSYRVWAFRAEAIRVKAHRLSEDRLLGAYHLPDHNEKAKQIFREELAARGYDDKRIADWRRPVSQITVPPAVNRSIDRLHYFKIVRTRRRLFQVFRFGVILFWASIVFLIFGIIGVTFLLLVLLLLLVCLAAILGRNRAVRILLLRPFGARELTKPLKLVVRQDLGPLGPVFTLSDRTYKPNPLLTMAALITWIARVVIAPLLRQTISFARVSTEMGFSVVAVTLFNRWWLSLNSFLTGGQAFTIRSTDPWWQNVIDLLMHSSDIIIMDVSRVSEGSTWEIHRLEADILVRKCIFIVQELHQQEGADSIGHLFPADSQPDIFVYDDEGIFKDHAKFLAVLEAAVARTVAAWGKPQRTDLPVNTTVAA